MRSPGVSVGLSRPLVMVRASEFGGNAGPRSFGAGGAIKILVAIGLAVTAWTKSTRCRWSLHVAGRAPGAAGIWNFSLIAPARGLLDTQYDRAQHLGGIRPAKPGYQGGNMPKHGDLIRRTARLGTFLLAIAMSQAAYSAEVCPAKLSDQYSSGAYRFEYQSWSWADEHDKKSLLFCHCVRNHSTGTALWVEWEKTSLKGFAAPGETVYSYYAIEGGTERKETVDLWYGAQPDHLRVSTAFNNRQDDPVAPAANNRPAKKTEPSEYSSGHTGGALLSAARISVPNLAQLGVTIGDPFGPRLNDKEIREIVERKPDILAPMEMQFESTPKVDRNGRWIAIENKCTYLIRQGGGRHGPVSAPRPGGAWRGLYRMRIKDAALNASVFQTDGTKSFEPQGFEPASYSGTTPVSPNDASRIQRRMSELQVITGADVVVASMPIVYYAVDMPKVAANQP
jgi:hypothetical protein